MKLTPVYQTDAYDALKTHGLVRHDDAMLGSVGVAEGNRLLAVGCLRDASGAKGDIGASLSPVVCSFPGDDVDSAALARACRRATDALHKSAAVWKEYLSSSAGELAIAPISRAECNEYVRRTHRHNDPSIGDISRVQLVRRIGDGLFERVGVGTFGRPVARALATKERTTIEILRVATDGRKNASTRILGAICRIAAAMGYEQAITYTLASEGGASLCAANFSFDGVVPAGGHWSVPSRPRKAQRVELEGVEKVRWRRAL